MNLNENPSFFFKFTNHTIKLNQWLWNITFLEIKCHEQLKRSHQKIFLEYYDLKCKF